MEKGKLIAFEGIDGSGKSTQVQLLAERMKREGIACYTTMEPTYAPAGSLIRQVLTGRMRMDNRAVALLFAADRLDHLLNEVNGIAAMVSEGTTVITDRYYFSSYAYHSVDMPMEQVIQANAPSREILQPAVTVFIDVDPDTAMDRILRNRAQQELFEKKSRLEEVRKKYFEAFERLGGQEKVFIVNGNRRQEEIAEEVWAEVCKYL